MTRSLIFACLVYTSLSAGSASEAHACPVGSEGSCEGGDKNVLLQSKMQYEDAEVQQMEAHEMGGPTAKKLRCDEDGDTNCCFTQAGADFALKTAVSPKGTKAGMCAAGAKELYPKQWKMVLSKEYVVLCPGDACTNYNPKGLQMPKGPASGKCSDFTCTNGFLPKTAVAQDAVCTTVSECEANCCQVDINADKKRRNEFLTFATIQALKNVSAIASDLDEENGRKKNHDLGKDVKRLKDNVAGLFNSMRKVLGSEKGSSYCPDGDISSIKGCVHNALCIIEKNLDPKGAEAMSKKELKTYTLLTELYEKFQSITWDRMMTALGRKTEGMTFNKVNKAELACAGLSGSLKAVSSKSLLEEADTEDQEAAYRVSAALVDAAMTTHDVLDSHKANSSVDETVAALHRAWQVPCEMLDCDHTNYWDLFGASHRHSLALIESGASASHMKAHIAARTRLEYRMQLFLGTDGNQFADRFTQIDGTATAAHVEAYVDVLCDAATQLWLEHPKKYGVDSLLTSLVSREQLIDHATTDLQKHAVQAVLDDSLVIYSNKATLQKMMREKGLSVSDELDEEDDAPLSEGERSSLLDRSLSRKGVKKVFEKVGDLVVKHCKMCKDIIAPFVLLGEVIVTIGTALGNVINAFADFILTMVQCLGFAKVGTVGYAKAWPDGKPARFVCVQVAMTKENALNNVLNWNGNSNTAVGVAITLGVVVGAIVGDGSMGLKVGVGMAGGFACGVNSNSVVTGEKGQCIFTLGVGVTASAAVTKRPEDGTYDARCAFGVSFKVVSWVFKCSVSHGVTMKIMCCSFNLMTGCQSCGTAGCKDDGMKVSEKASEVDKAVAQGEGAGIACDEGWRTVGRVDSRNYRGCQYQTTSGRTCQSWAAQNPHKHTQCSSTQRKLTGFTQVNATTAKEEATGEEEGAEEEGGEEEEGGRRRRRFHSTNFRRRRTRRRVRCETQADVKSWYTCIGEKCKGCSQARLDKYLKDTHVTEWCTTAVDVDKGMGDHNYCRNPDGKTGGTVTGEGIWCYTLDANKEWEFCDPGPNIRRRRSPPYVARRRRRDRRRVTQCHYQNPHTLRGDWKERMRRWNPRQWNMCYRRFGGVVCPPCCRQRFAFKQGYCDPYGWRGRRRRWR